MKLSEAIKSVKIEKNIPVQSRGHDGANEIRKFLRSVELNDSFLLEGMDPPYVTGMLSRYAKEIKIKISVKKTEHGTRVWRIA